MISMKRRPLVRIGAFLLGLASLLASAACQAPVNAPVADIEGASSVTIPADVEFGTGTFMLPDPSVGLTDLPSYKASLTVAFDGTRNGEPSVWSKTYLMLSAHDPAARQLTITGAGDIADLDPVFLAEAAGAAYESRAGHGCNATVIDPENSLIARLAPAGLLAGVIGADEAGSESINDVPADHFTFDERALGLAGLATATGELWLAPDGGYVVKYSSITEGDADYFGDGAEGTLTLEYTVTEVDQPIPMDLPADCPPGMVDAPLMPDASGILNMPSVLSFHTSAGLDEISAFYQEQLAPLGWTLVGDPAAAESSIVLDFTREQEDLTLVAVAAAQDTEVHILLAEAMQ
jgi:hypothetical protein